MVSKLVESVMEMKSIFENKRYVGLLVLREVITQSSTIVVSVLMGTD